ncbi:MAG: flagellin [Phycisphaerae bacterium]|nr:flagellin [Phycisphaerae bacterium]
MTRINTNVQSLISRRVLNTQNQALNRSLSRLSTGLRINSGRDDPAGLIASEDLRSTKVAISAAIDNARRADSVISVAEGSLQEISSLLLQLESLVDRTANEGGLSPNEVEANQLQIDTILESIDRISNESAFNSIRLLDGNLDFTTSGVNAQHLTNTEIRSAKIPNGGYRDVVMEVQASSLQGRLDYTGGALASNTAFQIRGNYGTELFSFASGAATSAVAFAINSTSDLTGVTASANGNTVSFQSTNFGADAIVSVSVLDGTFALQDRNAAAATENYGRNGTIVVNGSLATVDGLNAVINAGSMSMKLTLDSDLAQSATTTSFQITGGGAVFSIASEVSLAGQATIGLGSVTAGSLGKQITGTGSFVYLSSLRSGGANDMDSKNFTMSQRVTREAIAQISTMRGRVGTFQTNTLDTMISMLQVTNENLSAAESAIRDADFAVEASELTRAQILVNSSMMTLQQANQQPATVLQLLG